MTFLSLDFETGGLNSVHCGLVQVGAVAYSLEPAGLLVLNEYEAIFRREPGLIYEDQAIAVHGITEERQKAEGKSEWEILPEILNRISVFAEGGLVGSNIERFDWAFLKAACARQNIAELPHVRFLDVKRLWKDRYGPGVLKSVSLQEMARFFWALRLDEQQAHGGIEDARLAMHVHAGLSVGRPVEKEETEGKPSPFEEPAIQAPTVSAPVVGHPTSRWKDRD